MLGDGVIAGLRMEPELARALRTYAEKMAQEHSIEVEARGGAPVRPNVAAAARDLLRRALSVCDSEHSCRREGYFAGLAEARVQMGTALAGMSR